MFCIITGKEFTGKTSLVDKYLKAKDLKKYIRLYVTKSLDLKSLIGNYVCSENLGEFEWRDGPLAAAYKQGYLLILENLDSAKDEFYQMINSSIEGSLDIKGSANTGKHPNFKILGTWQTANEEEELKVKRIVDKKPFISSLDLKQVDVCGIFNKFSDIKSSPLL
jgi:midasin (ATPase involved in ribosome maturation)